MMRIEILTEGFQTPNGRAFLFPLVVFRRALAEHGIVCSLRRHEDKVQDADIVVIESKYLRDRWAKGSDGIFEEVARLRRRARTIVYADTGDSAGWLQSRILPHVDVYWKGLLLRDRNRYLQPMYGHRLYADHYHRRYDVADAKPEWSLPVANACHLGRLRTAWNSGLADYSWLGPYRMAAYERCTADFLLSAPSGFVAPSADRPIAVHCRMGLNYPRASVAWQRRAIAERLHDRMPVSKVSRRRYIRELEQSRLCVSPFGFGEITLKDFEALLAGALLCKPDMTHMETWPDLFRAGETMVAHDWDLNDFAETIERVLADYPRFIELAREGQRRYRDCLTDPGPFVRQLMSLVKIKTPASAQGAHA